MKFYLARVSVYGDSSGDKLSLFIVGRCRQNLSDLGSLKLGSMCLQRRRYATALHEAPCTAVHAAAHCPRMSAQDAITSFRSRLPIGR